MFLPADHETPKGTNYMKFQDGENKVRILTPPIIGWQDWTPEKKPIRHRYTTKPPKSIVESTPVKYFWAFVVWNYQESKIQILLITQKMIWSGLEKLSKDPEWSSPYFYDIKITKVTKPKVSYTLTPLPCKPVSIHIINEFNEIACDLEALFTGADPFNSSGRATKGIFSQNDLSIPSVNDDVDFIIDDKPSMAPFDELKEHLEIEEMDTSFLQDYVNDLSARKKEPVEKIVSSALLVLPQFKNLYAKEVSRRMAMT